MSFRIQILADTRRDYQPAVRHATRGKVWQDMCKPVSRLSVAERVSQNFKTDNANAIVRIRPVERRA